MKPVIIIAIAVVCSVVAVFGVSITLQEIAYYQYNEESDNEQMKIVTAYNKEIQRCRTVFVNNIMGEIQCMENAVGNFQIYLLDDEHYKKLAFIPSESNTETFQLPRTYGEAKYQLKVLCDSMYDSNTKEHDECIGS